MPSPYTKLSKKEFNSNKEAKKFAETKIREKTNKGYAEK